MIGASDVGAQPWRTHLRHQEFRRTRQRVSSHPIREDHLVCCNVGVADIDDIKQVKYRYLRALDTKHWDDFAATLTEDACDITREEVANASLMVVAPAMLKALRQIARDADFRQDDGAMDLGQRLIDIERDAKATIALYESLIADWRPRGGRR